MEIRIITRAASHSGFTVILYQKGGKKPSGLVSAEEWAALTERTEGGQEDSLFADARGSRLFCCIKEKKVSPDLLEQIRMKGAEALAHTNRLKCTSATLVNHGTDPDLAYAWAEGFALASYQFLRYKGKKKELQGSAKELIVTGDGWDNKRIKELNGLVAGVMLCRDLINEPHSHLTATQFSREMEKAGKKAGFSTKVLHKKQIEALSMGGLLGVNMGSIEPPTFTVMEYRPAKARNKKPLVLVGKGVVFDTGGLSLKPTPSSMDEMKCDMSGAAAVVGTLFAIAQNKLPVYVIGLVPATDNRPGMNAIVPQDVLTISNGITVEVMNTDAEGRLILADALVYAQRYNPELVIDLATLTGAAVRAIGSYASAVMGTAPQEIMDNLMNSGMHAWERMWQFPLWKDYGEEIKSDVADIKNLGLGNAGQISAAKFLEHFIDYPWIHMDIAGPAWSNSAQGYRTKGGTGVGVRALYAFIQKHYVNPG